MNIVVKIERKTKMIIRKLWHLRTAYHYNDVMDKWQKYRFPILGNKDEGIFFDPFVRVYNSKFVMYVSHRNSKSIVRCESEDGVMWTSPIIVLDRGIGCWDDNVNRASVVRKGNLWYMWYTGIRDNAAKIGIAFSNDGIHFRKYEANPIIEPEESFENQAVMNPCVLWDEKDKIFKMWYAAGEKYEPDVICYAESINGIDWTKYKNNPVLCKSSNFYDKAKVGGCDVVKLEQGYVMYYIGYENVDNARICMATSKDGIHDWTRSADNPIISPSRGNWDAHAVYKPTYVFSEQNGKAYLWYNGRKGSKEYIGLATRTEKNFS